MKKSYSSPRMVFSHFMVFGVVLMCSTILLAKYSGITYSVGENINSNMPLLSMEANNDLSPPAKPIIIDPGHGGEDGGAVSESGIMEKDLNLAVSDDIACLSLLFGIPYQMTRNDDRLLYDYYSELTDYTGKKKSLDLKNRLKIAEEADCELYISIHMNKFGDSRYSGLQIYYSPNHENGLYIAETVQNYVKSHLQKNNERLPKAANSSIYILNKIEKPAILVECGFLSNTDETSKLCTADYRCALASAVFTPIAEYYVRSSHSS